MQTGPTGHDQDAAVHDRNTASLSSALDRLRLAGAIFLRGRYTEAWTYESVPADDARALLAPGAPRVFFVQPQDGAMVTSPVKLEFGLENYQLAAVPPDAKEARAGMGHHHVSVDTDCLPTGARPEQGKQCGSEPDCAWFRRRERA